MHGGRHFLSRGTGRESDVVKALFEYTISRAAFATPDGSKGGGVRVPAVMLRSKPWWFFLFMVERTVDETDCH
jgi:hypothetical protein